MESQHITPTESQEYPSIFKENKIQEIEWFLEERQRFMKEGVAITKEDVVNLATTVSVFKQTLFDTYHNLFQFQHENSAGYIKRIKEGYEKDQKNVEPGGRDYEIYQKRITIAESFITFTEKFGWTNANATARLLEDVLV